MSLLTQRVLIRFSLDEMERLRTLAKTRGESLAALIRGAVAETYLRNVDPERVDAVRRMAEMRLPVADWEQMERESAEENSVDACDSLR